jgi:hypothetical protein
MKRGVRLQLGLSVLVLVGLLLVPVRLEQTYREHHPDKRTVFDHVRAVISGKR